MSKSNRLALESSLYLRQHANNPVDWHPWGPEALSRARELDRPIFLSIGYSACHWCHVMEHESFENAEIAALMNEHFICIKVDREERPDIDDIYMTALHVMGTRGGWPMSMFLTPDGKPIVGGTYWPREDREIEGEKVNGFKTILKKIVEIWKDKPKEVEMQAAHYAEETSDALARLVRVNPIVTLDRDLARGAALALSEEIDSVHGGIGRKANKHRGTKFPMSSSVSVLFDHAVREKDDDLRKQVVLTLDKMAMGGIYDQLGGGFHRYSTERTWTVPHFEKMLYDNAQLVELYAEAFKQWKNPEYARVVRETLDFVKREMTSPDGGFYSALDADSNGTEGEFYVWTPEEIEKAIGNKTEIALLRAIYNVGNAPNFEEKFFILRLNRPFEEIAKEQKMSAEELGKKLAAIKTKMMAFRAKRERPFLDTKILAAWNGQMIAGYAKAGEILKEPEYIKTAVRAADFVLKNLRTKEGRLLRTYSKTADGKFEAKLNGYLDDYAFFIHGLLNLHDASGDSKWLDEAKKLADVVIKWHNDGDKGGYFFTSSDHEKLFARPKDYYDNAQPSANGVFVRDLIRIGKKTKDDEYRKLAEKTIRQFAGVVRSNPSSVPGMCLALHMYLDAKGETPQKKDEKKKGPPPITGMETTEDVVKYTASLSPAKDGKHVATLSIAISAPWYIYANPVGSKQFAGNATTVTIRGNGKIIPADIEYPKGAVLKTEGLEDLQIYENEVTIKAVIPATTEPLEIAVKLQACSKGDKGVCLLQTTLKMTVK